MSDNEEFTAYCTKYALTSGIFSFRARLISPSMVQDCGQRYATYYHIEGKNWHRTLDRAIAQAEAMRLKRVKSLKASIAKLERLTFGLEAAE